jgi:hypothetical protein
VKSAGKGASAFHRNGDEVRAPASGGRAPALEKARKNERHASSQLELPSA